MNNATCYELFDSAVKAHFPKSAGVDIRGLPAVGVVAETSCRYFRPVPPEIRAAVDALRR